jgi:hypothetical protein
MVSSKTYLKVPYAEKDAAKALGARWDAAEKKWYITESVDPHLFTKWTAESKPTANTTSPTTKPAAKAVKANSSSGVFTKPSIPNFIAYNGDEPPWN